MFLDFKKWIKSIQTAGYNGVRTVYEPGQSLQQGIQVVAISTLPKAVCGL